jgi:Protein tyrosine and serine/threonine kinase
MVVGGSSSVGVITALIQSCISICQAETLQLQYKKDVAEIMVLLIDLLCQKKTWTGLLYTENGGGSSISWRLHDALKDICFCLQAATTEESSWRSVVAEFLADRNLAGELRSAKQALSDVVATKLKLQQSVLIDEQMTTMSVTFSKILNDPSFIDPSRTKKQDIDDALEDCFIETSTSTFNTTSSLSDHAAVDVPIIDKSQLEYEEDRRYFLGKGSFAEVYRGTYQGETVAVKIVNAFVHVKNSSRKMFVEELQIMYACSIHPNIAQLRGYSAPLDVTQKPLIVLELVDDTLYNLVHNEKHQICMVDLLQLVKGVASAVEFLHLQGIIHHDIQHPCRLYPYDCKGN